MTYTRYINITILSGHGTIHGVMRVPGQLDVIFDVIISEDGKVRGGSVERNVTNVIEVIGRILC